MAEIRIQPNSEFVRTKLEYYLNESQNLKKYQQLEHERVTNDGEGERKALVIVRRIWVRMSLDEGEYMSEIPVLLDFPLYFHPFASPSPRPTLPSQRLRPRPHHHSCPSRDLIVGISLSSVIYSNNTPISSGRN